MTLRLHVHGAPLPVRFLDGLWCVVEDAGGFLLLHEPSRHPLRSYASLDDARRACRRVAGVAPTLGEFLQAGDDLGAVLTRRQWALLRDACDLKRTWARRAA